MSNNTGRYQGLSKAELLSILSDAGGDREKISDADAFQIAWNEADKPPQEEEVIVIDDKSAIKLHEKEIDGINFEIPPELPQWSLIPIKQIEEANDDLIFDIIHELNSKYNQPLPNGLNQMEMSDIKDWIKEVVCRPELKNQSEKVNSDNNLLSRIQNGLTRININGRVLMNYDTIGDYLHLKYHTLSFCNQIYIFDETRGIYRINQGDIEEAIARIYKLAGCQGSIKRDTAEIIHLILTKDRFLEYPFNNHPGVIPLLNGLIKLNYEEKRVSFVPHSPEFKFNYRLPIRYNPNASPEPIHKILSSYVDSGEELSLLYQIPAQSLLQAEGKLYRKSYILKGPKRAGKSSYLVLLNWLFGEENIASQSLQELSGKYALATLEGKLLNIYDDLSKESLNYTGTFKNLTGSIYHYVEKKYQMPYNAKISAVHVFSANELPQMVQKDDEAFWDRFEICLFTNSFEVDGNFYEDNFTPDNLDGYFIRVLITAMEIVSGAGLVHNSSAEEVQDLWLIDSDPIYQFIKLNCIKSGDGVIPKDSLYSAYVSDAKSRNLKEVLSQDTFWKRIKRFGFTQSRPEINGKRVRCYIGYKWNRSSQYFEEYELKSKTVQRNLSFISSFSNEDELNSDDESN